MNRVSAALMRGQQTVLQALERHTPPAALPAHLVTGLRGEQAALFYLRGLGYTIVAQRWSSPKLRGDLDLVAWTREADGSRALVIFEIKTRTARDFAPADTAVDRNKRRQLRWMTGAYLRQFPREHRESLVVRIDLLSVYFLRSGVEFEHFPSAVAVRE